MLKQRERKFDEIIDICRDILEDIHSSSVVEDIVEEGEAEERLDYVREKT